MGSEVCIRVRSIAGGDGDVAAPMSIAGGDGDVAAPVGDDGLRLIVALRAAEEDLELLFGEPPVRMHTEREGVMGEVYVAHWLSLRHI